MIVYGAAQSGGHRRSRALAAVLAWRRGQGHTTARAYQETRHAMQITETPLNARQPDTYARADVRCPSCSTRASSVIVMAGGAIACGFCGHRFDPTLRHRWAV